MHRNIQQQTAAVASVRQFDTTGGKIIRERRPIRFRLAPRMCAPCGLSTRVVPDRLAESRKISTRKHLPLFFREHLDTLDGAGWGRKRDGPGGGALIVRVRAAAVPVVAVRVTVDQQKNNFV